MSFATREFFIFLPVVLLVYRTLHTRAQKFRFLLMASWFFYMWWNPWLIGIILFTTVVDYATGLLIEAATTAQRRRAWLCLSLTSNLGFLAFFKYSHFLLENSLALARAAHWPVPEWTFNIVLPIGISFHTFQGMSYTIEVYRRQIRAVRSFADFALFIGFFPQLVAGPIVRASEFLPQMVTPPPVRSQDIEEGLHWFVVGLFKKVFIADQLAQFVDTVFAHPELYDAVTHRWAVLAYAAQIYCDFSGYSDMAIGCAKWFGFTLPRNFNLPYLAASITDFWRRWHITLSAWLRDYLYIPLGGNRRGAWRTYLNLLVTMTVCGLWHGAHWNYVLWGAYNGALVAAHHAYDRVLHRRPWAERLRSRSAFTVVATAGTLLLVLTGFVMVRSQSWSGCWLVQRSLVGWDAGGAGTRWVPVAVPALVGLVAAGHALGALGARTYRLLDLPPALRAATYATAVVLLVVLGPWSSNTFIYFQF